MKTQPTQLSHYAWQDIEITESVTIDNRPHFSRRAIGEFLEYDNPQKAIDNIVGRNEYIETYSTTLNLRAVDQKIREIQLFSPIGFLLIVMESQQPKAKRMKEQVAAFVDHYVFNPQPTDPQITISEQIRLRKQLFDIADKLEKETSSFKFNILKDQFNTIAQQMNLPDQDMALIDQHRNQNDMLRPTH